MIVTEVKRPVLPCRRRRERERAGEREIDKAADADRMLWEVGGCQG